MQIEEAIKKIKGKNIFSSEKTETGYDYMENINEVVNILLIYVETMQKEFYRLEDIEDNTTMLKYEIEKKDNVIHMMVGWLYAEDTGFGYGALKDINTPEKIEEYFYKKVGKENDAVGK